MDDNKDSKRTTYSRETLLNIRKACTHRRRPVQTPDPLSQIPELRKTQQRKRGRRAGVLVRLRRRAKRAPLPSMLLANVQSLDNKLWELRARISSHPGTATWSVSQRPGWLLKYRTMPSSSQASSFIGGIITQGSPGRKKAEVCVSWLTKLGAIQGTLWLS